MTPIFLKQNSRLVTAGSFCWAVGKSPRYPAALEQLKQVDLDQPGRPMRGSRHDGRNIKSRNMSK
jgi:hypothetical protein